jgi:hypothetical protein
MSIDTVNQADPAQNAFGKQEDPVQNVLPEKQEDLARNVLPEKQEDLARNVLPENLTLDSVDYRRSYVLSKSSIGQIMKAMSVTTTRLNNPKNNYEQILFPGIKNLLNDLIKEYNTLLIFSDEPEHSVKKINLIGNLPKPLSLLEQEHRIQLHTANIGNLIKACYQRIDFILNRDVPVFYKENQNYLPAFNKMQNELRTFKEKVREFENNFKNLIDQAHKSGHE